MQIIIYYQHSGRYPNWFKIKVICIVPTTENNFEAHSSVELLPDLLLILLTDLIEFLQEVIQRREREKKMLDGNICSSD
jgi:hypothetical protein